MLNRLTEVEMKSTYKLTVDKLKNSDFHWILDSSLTHRAYLLGVFNTLDLLGDTNNIQGELLLSLSRTMFAKSSDKLE